MSKKAFTAIKTGLDDAVAYARGDKSRAVAHQIAVPDVDVRALRERLAMSQERFAEAFMVSVGTVRNWEQGRRIPDGPARMLLNIIQREPRAVLRALSKMQTRGPKNSAA